MMVLNRMREYFSFLSLYTQKRQNSLLKFKGQTQKCAFSNCGNITTNDNWHQRRTQVQSDRWNYCRGKTIIIREGISLIWLLKFRIQTQKYALGNCDNIIADDKWHQWRAQVQLDWQNSFRGKNVIIWEEISFICLLKLKKQTQKHAFSNGDNITANDPWHQWCTQV